MDIENKKNILPQMINFYRKQNNLTMKELGNKLGKAESTISLWISGKRSPMIEDLENLSNIFNVSIEDLTFGKRPSDTDLEAAIDHAVFFGGKDIKELSPEDRETMKNLLKGYLMGKIDEDK